MSENIPIPAGKDEMRILADTKEIFVVADSPSDYDAYCMHTILSRCVAWCGGIYIFLPDNPCNIRQAQ